VGRTSKGINAHSSAIEILVYVGGHLEVLHQINNKKTGRDNVCGGALMLDLFPPIW